MWSLCIDLRLERASFGKRCRYPLEDRAGRHAVLLRTWAPYLCLSLMQFAAQTAANHSVHFVDFTVKVVFKASKLLPTMLVSTLMGNARSFTPVEYLAALLLCGGTAMFSHGGGKASVACHPLLYHNMHCLRYAACHPRRCVYILNMLHAILFYATPTMPQTWQRTRVMRAPTTAAPSPRACCSWSFLRSNVDEIKANRI